MPGGRPATKYFTEEDRKAAAVARATKWREDNRERYLENEKARVIRNAENIKASKKKWAKANPEKVKEIRRLRMAKRKEEDPVFRFKEITKGLIKNSFSRGKKKLKKVDKTEEILGCTIDYFREYILSLCPEGTSLKDFGRFGYHIDHIIPVSLAKTEEEVIKLCHYTNFQPLFWVDNIQKSNKIF